MKEFFVSPDKVIFAGNPLNYGDERRLAPFFARHGNALVLEPMPQECIDEDILKPVFAGTMKKDDQRVISTSILAVYDYLCRLSLDEILITPRELQMMAMLTCSYQRRYPDKDPEHIAKHYAYQLAKPLVPTTHQKEFEDRFAQQESLCDSNAVNSQHMPRDFLLTPSRRLIHQTINDWLSLRELKRETTGNDALCYGGLGGLVLEGEPGIGKSELVISALVKRGYKESRHYSGHLIEQQPGDDKYFYRMPVTMQLDEKKRLLLKAFNEGAVVIIDEINSSPMMERLLNDLLMGVTPEGSRPLNPGFMVIGTQNPSTMAGRREASTALKRRTIHQVLTPYTHEEMLAILEKKGLESDEANCLVHAYETNLDKAHKEHLNPAPTFRDLLRVADNLREATKKTNRLAKTREQEIAQPLLSRKKKTIEDKKESELKRNELDKPEDVGTKHKTRQQLQFKDKIDRLKQKISQFEHNNPDAHQAVKVLVEALEKEGNTYFQDTPTTESYTSFKLNCEKHITTARVVLDKHRGWGKVLLNLAAFIGTIGIGYLLAAGINMALNKGKFTFFSTDSSDKLDEIEKLLPKIAPK